MFLRLNYINIKKHLFLKLIGYRNYGKRKMWFSCDSVYFACLVWCVIHALWRFAIEPAARPSEFMLQLSYWAAVTLTIDCDVF